MRYCVLFWYQISVFFWLIFHAFINLHVQFYETTGRGGRNKGGEHRISGQIALRKTSVSPPPFYFPEIFRLDLYTCWSQPKQKDDRSEIALFRERESERAGDRAIALSLIFSDWLAGLPIWPIIGEIRGTANRNYIVGATIKFARENEELYSAYMHRFLSLSRDRWLWFWIRSMASDRINKPVSDRFRESHGRGFRDFGIRLFSHR